MNVLYEEDGGYKAALILADNDSSLQVEAPHGKRSKIKATSIVLRFDRPAAGEFMQVAQRAADEMDVDFLWQCSAADEFGFSDLARDYFGHEPSSTESAAVLLRLHAAPMYFYKKGRGRFRAAPEENLRAALAGLERKRRQEEQKKRYVESLVAGKVPEELAASLDDLLYAPDKNSIEWKAVEDACAATQESVPRLFARCGALASSRDYHVGRFVREQFPRGLPATDDVPADDPDLPESSARAFSIDDASTTEIDDAFSVVPLDTGGYRVGIHIAAPTLGVLPGSGLDGMARAMLSTIYMPGSKITMLPPQAIERYTLSEGRSCPALSMYLTLDEGFRVVSSHSVFERVAIVSNVRHADLDEHFTETALADERGDYPFKAELRVLWKLATALEAARGKAEKPGLVDYSFSILDDGRISIAPRLRGTPVDKVVSELMILVNTEWGRELAAQGLGAIYRTQRDGRTTMSREPGPHQGLGVAQYAWSSSPLRRYVDLVNQRQLYALYTGSEPPYGAGNDELVTSLRDFELAYDAYNEFQRNMERYWCLRYVLQEGIRHTRATVLREGLVRLVDLPLVCRVPGLPALPSGTEVDVELNHVDEWDATVQCHYRGT